MGSGIRVNIFRQSYQGNLIDTEQVSDQKTEQVVNRDNLHTAILKYCSIPKSLKEIMEHFNYKHRPSFVNNYIKTITKF